MRNAAGSVQVGTAWKRVACPDITNKGCLTCPIRCARTVTVQGKAVKGPELETLGLLGGNICNNDLQKILDWNYQLDELGMDTISTANTIAYAMEANEQGLWDNGLAFGSVEELSAIFDDIAHRRGIGDELAEGSKRLSKKYGGKEFAMHEIRKINAGRAYARRTKMAM